MELSQTNLICDNQTVENVISKIKSSNEYCEEIKNLEEKCQSLELQLKNEIKEKKTAEKDKEAMVIRYAVSEKNYIKQIQLCETLDKKYKESIGENEILQHKIQMMNSDKARICQILDNKTYECKTIQQELQQIKFNFTSLETKLKWSQNSLKTEMQLHKECQTQLEYNVQKVVHQKKESDALTEDTKEANSNQQLKEVQAQLILLKYEKNDKEQEIKKLLLQIEKLQNKQKEIMEENNELSVKIQLLECERLENNKKLSDFRTCADQQRQSSTDLQAKNALIGKIQLQLKNEQEQFKVCNEQVDFLKQRNAELELDILACRKCEADLLLFTQQLTDKNVKLQSEFTALETKVQQLSCEQTLLKRQLQEYDARKELTASQTSEERIKLVNKIESIELLLREKIELCEKLKQECADYQGENDLLRRKYELSLREVNKELHQCRKKLQHLETLSKSNSSSNSSLCVTDGSKESPTMEQVKVIQPDGTLDKQTLIEHIVKLQKISARKSEKIDFLEEHVNTLVLELQKKTRLLQNYILRDQSGTLTSNDASRNKIEIAKLNGVMASIYGARVADKNLTLHLSLDINRKLQAVLEDALIKNITLQDNIHTLGEEIDRLNKRLKC